MISFIAIFLILLLSECSMIPEMATMDSCMNRRVTITDRNVRKAILFFRGCRNLGLTMGDLLPEDYMRIIAEKLRTANVQFLHQSYLPQPKLRMLEKELNDLYQEIIILSEKVLPASKQNCQDSTKTIPTTTCTTKQSTTTVCPTQDDANRIVDFFDYDYNSEINPCSETALFIYLLVLSIASLIVGLWTCRISTRTHHFLKELQEYDEEVRNIEK